MRHTQGPLKSQGQYVVAPDGRMVAQLPPLHEDTLGNSFLFSAAPELLEALKQAEAFVADDTCRHDYEKATLLVVIANAIAKAEGRS